MTLEIGLIAASIILLIVAAGCVAVVSRVYCSTVVRWLASVSPATRTNLLMVWAALPLLAGGLLLLCVFAPSLAHLLGVGTDHCHVHGHHSHLCLLHTVAITGGVVDQVILAGASAATLLWALIWGIRLRTGTRAVRQLQVLLRSSSRPVHYHVVQSTRPFAVTVGMLRPKILISSRLLAELEPAEVTAVLAHEQAHQRRRDGLRLLFADIVIGPHLPSVRHCIMTQLKLAIEQACDESAAKQTGDRLRVAEAILKLTRLINTPMVSPGSFAPSFIDSDPTQRIEGLIRPPLPARPLLNWALSAVGICVLTVGLVTSDWWHHSVESLFSLHLG